MGILKTRWAGEYEGHKVSVVRNELSKHISLEWDGVEIADKRTVTGHGEVRATVEIASGYRDSPSVEVVAKVGWGGAAKLAHGDCKVSVGTSEIAIERVG